MAAKSTDLTSGEGDAAAQAVRRAYPDAHVDLERLNQIVRHRVRNVCGGCRMLLDMARMRLSTAGADSAIQWDSLYAEVENMQQFSSRLDLLLSPLPEPQEETVAAVFGQLREDVVEQFPLCTVRFEGPMEERTLSAGNWYRFLLRELVVNAGRAAGRNGTVEVAWSTSPRFEVAIANDGGRFPGRIPLNPPVPFKTTHPSRDGLGLSIAYRLSLALDADLTFRDDLPDVTAVCLAAGPATPTEDV